MWWDQIVAIQHLWIKSIHRVSMLVDQPNFVWKSKIRSFLPCRSSTDIAYRWISASAQCYWWTIDERKFWSVAILIGDRWVRPIDGSIGFDNHIIVPPRGSFREHGHYKQTRGLLSNACQLDTAVRITLTAAVISKHQYSGYCVILMIRSITGIYSH